MPPDPHSGTASPLSRILSDLETAGIRPTPLGVIARATDLGMSDAEVSSLVAELAAVNDLGGIAA